MTENVFFVLDMHHKHGRFIGLSIISSIWMSEVPNQSTDVDSTVCHKSCYFILFQQDPCGGGVEYLHCDPASRRRRRKGKSQYWDSKIWSEVPRDSDPRMTALARASSTCKRQTRPLVREGAPQAQDRNCHTSNKDLVVSPRWVLYSKTDWLADRRS
jgi:hypothetical protein